MAICKNCRNEYDEPLVSYGTEPQSQGFCSLDCVEDFVEPVEDFIDGVCCNCGAELSSNGLVIDGKGYCSTECADVSPNVTPRF